MRFISALLFEYIATYSPTSCIHSHRCTDDAKETWTASINLTKLLSQKKDSVFRTLHDRVATKREKDGVSPYRLYSVEYEGHITYYSRNDSKSEGNWQFFLLRGEQYVFLAQSWIDRASAAFTDEEKTTNYNIVLMFLSPPRSPRFLVH
jgi:hypothetical protein